MHVDQPVPVRRLHTRRAWGLLVMSTVLTGSAQYVAGRRNVGRVAMRGWAVILGAALLAGLGLLLLRGPTITVLLNPVVVGALGFIAWLAFAAWTLLLLDAWRLARPIRLVRQVRLALTLAVVALVAMGAFLTSTAANALTAAGNLSEVLQGGGDRTDNEGRYNILLLGADAAASRDGIRPDSINVASIDASTGRTVIFGLPRNLQGAPFPQNSPLHSLYPDGFRCENDACMLNGVHALAEENAELYPEGDAGLRATREVASELLGLEINYHAMVDMAGFETLVDAMGGITLNVGRDVPIGGGGSAVSGHVEAGENVHLDGYEALWLARSRHGSSDYERMIRQKCVMTAMAKQLDPFVMATRFVELSEVGKDLLVTDVGAGHVAELAELGLRAKSLDIVSINFAPPLIVTASPDLALIRSTVSQAIVDSESLDQTELSGGDETPATPAAPTAAPVSVAETSADEQPDPADSPGDAVAAEPSSASDAPVAVIETPPICSVS